MPLVDNELSNIPVYERELSDQMEYDSLDREEIINTRLYLDRVRGVNVHHVPFKKIFVINF